MAQVREGIMGKLTVIILLTMVIPIQASGDSFLSDWDTVDKILLASYTATWALDWGQTRDLAEGVYCCHEGNSLLGSDPDIKTVNVYFLGMYALNLFVADAIGDESGWFRKVYLLAFAVFHANYVEGNTRAGVEINFSF